MWRVIAACATGLVGFAFPRLLVAAGVPLEKWIRIAGERLGVAAEDINADAILWAISIIFFVLLTGVEAWRQPVARIWFTMRGRPFHLEGPVIAELISLTEEAQSLISGTDPDRDNWRRRAIEWDRNAKNMLEREFPQNELYGYTSLSLAPLTNSQDIDWMRRNLNARFQKFRRIVGRHLPRNRR